MSGIWPFVDQGPANTSNLFQHLKSKAQRGNPSGTQVRLRTKFALASGCMKNGEVQQARSKEGYLNVPKGAPEQEIRSAMLLLGQRPLRCAGVGRS